MEESVKHKIVAFFSAHPARSFEKNQLLVYANEEPVGVFYLVEGQVRQYDISGQGGEVIVNVFAPPAFFPMSWVVTGTPNRYFFEASKKTEVRIAPAADVMAFMKVNPDVVLDLLARVYSGTEGMQRRMAHLMGGSARTRLLFELITECKRFGTQQPSGAYRINLHEDELARRTGLTRETVNRELSVLKRTIGLFVSHAYLEIPQLDLLQQALGETL